MRYFYFSSVQWTSPVTLCQGLEIHGSFYSKESPNFWGMPLNYCRVKQWNECSVRGWLSKSMCKRVSMAECVRLCVRVSVGLYVGVYQYICHSICKCVSVFIDQSMPECVRVWIKPTDGLFMPQRAICKSTVTTFPGKVKLWHLPKAALRLRRPSLPIFLSPRDHFLYDYNSIYKRQAALPPEKGLAYSSLGPQKGCYSLRRALVVTVWLDSLGSNEVKRYFPAWDPGVQQLLAAEGRHQNHFNWLECTLCCIGLVRGHFGTNSTVTVGLN